MVLVVNEPYDDSEHVEDSHPDVPHALLPLGRPSTISTLKAISSWRPRELPAG